MTPHQIEASNRITQNTTRLTYVIIVAENVTQNSASAENNAATAPPSLEQRARRPAMSATLVNATSIM